MTASEVLAKLDAATTALAKTNKTYPSMVKAYGTDWTKWPPASQWYIARKAITDARVGVAALVSPILPVADFTYKEN